MATAQSYDANLPDTSMPDANGVGARWTDSDDVSTGKSIWEKIIRGFTGLDMEQQYQNLLTKNQRAYEQGLLKEQRAYEEYVRNREYEREDTTYQRMMKDLQAAGLNPLYALQGGLSGSSARTGINSSSSNIHDSSAERVKSKESASGIAALLVAVAKILAA